MANSSVLLVGLLILVVLLLATYLYYPAEGFDGRTDPFWTPHAVAPPIRRFYDAAAGPDGISGAHRRDWGDTYWAPTPSCGTAL